MNRKTRYTESELIAIYTSYAQLKGWSTKPHVVKDKVESWLSSSIGPVELAISFHETETDLYSEYGPDASARRSESPIQAAIFTLVGTEYANDDGSHRVDAALECDPFDVLALEQERPNPHDPNAIRILNLSSRRCIGYLSRRDVLTVLEYAKQGFRFTPVILSITRAYANGAVISEFLPRNDIIIKIVLFIFKLEIGTPAIDAFAESWEESYIRENSMPTWKELKEKKRG